MENDIQLTPKETDYFERLNKVVEPRNENPNISPGILIEQHAKNSPNRVALVYEDSSWTWNTFNKESNKISTFFLEKGTGLGDNVGVMMENSPQFLFITTGLNKIQAISSLININQRKKALIHAFNISEVKWVIVDGDSLPAFIEVFSDLNVDREHVLVINNPQNNEHNFIDFQQELASIASNNPDTTYNSFLPDTSMYIFTSGTTGLPKAAVQNNARLLNPFGYLAFQITQNDVLYSPLPLYHSHATVNGWGTVMNGGCTFAFRKRFSASEFWNDIKKFGVTCCLYIGEIPRYLLNRPESEYVKNNTLKKMLGLGLRKDIWAEFKTRFHIPHILEFYGATEGAGGLFNIQEIPGMIGRITIPDYLEIVKIDEDSGEFLKDERNQYIKCKPGEIGMMLVKIQTTSNFLGYKDKDKTESRVLRDIFEEGNLYFNTGDLVTLHEDNWVSFADRYGDTYRWKGENVSTLEVEAIVNGFDNIEMCTVYGVEIPKTDGKAGMVCIKLTENKAFDIDKFSQFVKENLPKYAIPIFLRMGEKLEFTGTHKLRKVNLKKQGYDINKIQDNIYIWDSKLSTYRIFSKEKYQSLMNNEIIL